MVVKKILGIMDDLRDISTGDNPIKSPNIAGMFAPPEPIILNHEDFSFMEWRAVWGDKEAFAPDKHKKITIILPPTWSAAAAKTLDENNIVFNTGNDEALLPDYESTGEYVKAFFHGIEVDVAPAKLEYTQVEIIDDQYLSIGLAEQGVQSNHICNIVAGKQDDKYSILFNTLLFAPIGEKLKLSYFGLAVLLNEGLAHEDSRLGGIACYETRTCLVSNAGLLRHNDIDTPWSKSIMHYTWPERHCLPYKCAHKWFGNHELALRAFLNDNPSITKRSPIIRAIFNHQEHFSKDGNYNDTQKRSHELYIFCNTLSHEVGHLFGLSHCHEYGCVMQSGNVENSTTIDRPPFLCPLCLRKIRYTLDNKGTRCSGNDCVHTQYEVDRYEAILKFCKKQVGAAFQAHVGWLEAILHKDEKHAFKVLAEFMSILKAP